MIYLNNGATSFPKPPSVPDAVRQSLEEAPDSGFRSSQESGADLVEACRNSLAGILGLRSPGGIYFTSGATEGFNVLWQGLQFRGRQIIVSSVEHNAVLRALFNHEGFRDYKITVIPCDGDGCVDPGAVLNEVNGDTAAVVANHCSNVTGALQDMEALGAALSGEDCLFIADVSQSAGCIPVNGDLWRADALVFTGHKSLFGPRGTGGFYLKEGTDFHPSRFGGTGRDGLTLSYGIREKAPIEIGTPNIPGLAGLKAGVDFVLEQGLGRIQAKEEVLLQRLLEGLRSLPLVHVYHPGHGKSGPVVSLTMEGLSPSDLAYILYHEYEIVLRAGFHCCPLIHKHLGTETQGTLRVSFSYLNNLSDIEALIEGLQDIHKGLTRGEWD